MTELIWEGKYKDGKKVAPVRIPLPFQTVETVNESAQERQRMLGLFSSGQQTEWRNRLIWGDKKYVLPSLLPDFEGKVNLIYIDPPFDTGADFSFTATIPDNPETDEDETTSFVKEPSIIEQKAYRDTWGGGLDSYLEWFYETAVLLRELLAEDGSIYVHLDWHVGHYVKAVMDEVFGQDNFRNEIVWQRTGAHNDPQRFGHIHDMIFFYSKSDKWTFNSIYVPHTEEHLKTRFNQVDEKTGRRFFAGPITAPGDGPSRRFRGQLKTPPTGRHWSYTQENIDELEAQGKIYYSSTGVPYLKQYMDEYVQKGRRIQSIWADLLPSKTGSELLDYPTQKPESLLERIIKASSNEGDLVLDCFVGSGTTAAVAEKLNRRWIVCDLGRFAIHTARKRLLQIPNVRPFVVQNLGKYERQAWQAAEFPVEAGKKENTETNYRKFILELYHATLVNGYTWLHGTKNGRMVHVGAVDAPVTLADVKAAAAEIWRAVGTGKDSPKTAGLDILGWEFAFEINEMAKQVAEEARVDVSFKKIPREVLEKKAVEQGDIHFYELAALKVDVKTKGRQVSLKLKDFVIPPDDVPADVQKVIKHWSQWIDYWAVDWDYKGDTFHNQWQSYRTRKERDLQKEISNTYEKSGHYTIVVKVIDILGNDTTKAIQVEVK